MENVRFPYRKDAFGVDVYARVTWSLESTDGNGSRPIALIYHAGGLLLGSSETVPQAQVQNLSSKGFVVVLPSYRLAPQATAQEAFQDCEEAFEWTTERFPQLIESQHGVKLNVSQVVAMGHSSGGTAVLHLASIGKPLKAVLALYPFLFVSDPSTNAQSAATDSLFGNPEGFSLTEADWAEITPSTHQVSEVALLPSADGKLTARQKWAMNVFKTGQWMNTLQPDGSLVSIDPMTRVSASWPPVMLIHGSEDNIPGRSVALMERAKREMDEAGLEGVRLGLVEGGRHLFDHFPGHEREKSWEVVREALDWLTGYAS